MVTLVSALRHPDSCVVAEMRASPNHNERSNGVMPDMIVLHYTGDGMATPRGRVMSRKSKVRKVERENQQKVARADKTKQRAEAARPKFIRVGGEVIRLMENSPVRDPHCIDCGVDTDESYMIHDELWRAANPAEAGMLCVGCCEKRLGRKLCRKDFPPYALSAFDEGMPVSARLKLRMEI
jgi:hypothetical protein